MKHKLPYKTIELLRDSLMRPGWAKHDSITVSTKRAFLSSQIVAEVLPEIPDVPADLVPTKESTVQEVRRFRVVQDEISAAEAEFELSDKQLDVCKTAVEAAIKDGAMPSFKYALRLITWLDMAPKD